MSGHVAIYDSTLRDGAQAEGISFSVEDKRKIVGILDDLGIAYIEAGNPGSNPKDMEFFSGLKDLKLKTARLTAFGSTRRRGVTAEEDSGCRSLLQAGTPAVAIFGKSWDYHVKDILKASLEENLEMIRDTVAFFKKKGKEVVFDAEHYFDGAAADEGYALRTLEAAVQGGADWLVLCDTNGGAFPLQVLEATRKAVAKFTVPVGVHCHNDGGMAVANSLMAVEAGATQVQGTMIGYGERCGNANLSVIIPALQLKKGKACLPEGRISSLAPAARLVAEISNVALDSRMPYVGSSAFAHKGGMHIDAVSKNPHSYEHVDPESIGNERRILMSEVSGRSTIMNKVLPYVPGLKKDSPEAQMLADMLKEMEHSGYQFEGAEASFELRVRKRLGKFKPFFQMERFTVIEELPAQTGRVNASALIAVAVDGVKKVTAAEGNGPVNALNKALREALEGFYPSLKSVHLTDYKVRVLNPEGATAARVRVWLESTDGPRTWSTVGVSTDVIEASCLALVDSIEYKLIKDLEGKYQAFL
jgi:2-isopropylmalate synthase